MAKLAVIEADDDIERETCAGSENPAMRGVHSAVSRVAASKATVLIRGETGTGKELIARALYEESDRKDRPFSVIHCAALPASTLESELFGHVEGSFTGALERRRGRIASAHGGTLFLDEIGEIPLEVQAKLLRFVQFGEVQTVGTDALTRVDVRIIAATHRDLRERTRSGQFRADLYYRLNVVELVLPPLRERCEDLPRLIDHFLRRHARTAVRQVFSAEAQELLLGHDYPGNVRELENLIQRCCALSGEPVIGVELLPAELSEHAGGRRPHSGPALTIDGLRTTRAQAVADAERAFLTKLMKQSADNVSSAARASGLKRSYLQRLLAKHALRTRL